jgi:hypothetical protein
MTNLQTWLWLALGLLMALAFSGCVSNQPAPAPQSASVSSVARTLAVLPPPGQSVTLAWNPVTNASGYRIYFGPLSGSYTNQVTVGNATNATVSGLTFGGWYHFSATALAASNLESQDSDDLFWVALPTNIDVEYPMTRVFVVSPFGLTTTNPPTGFFRSTLTKTNGTQYTWRLQSSGQVGGWTNTALTLTTSSRSQSLAMLNPTNWIVNTNYFTNIVGLASVTKPVNIYPIQFQ